MINEEQKQQGDTGLVIRVGAAGSDETTKGDFGPICTRRRHHFCSITLTLRIETGELE
jgi:hypothetical protein